MKAPCIITYLLFGTLHEEVHLSISQLYKLTLQTPFYVQTAILQHRKHQVMCYKDALAHGNMGDVPHGVHYLDRAHRTILKIAPDMRLPSNIRYC